MIYSKVIADSISPTGSRLTTIEARYHLFIHDELLTHRAFSRNSASARAIPTSKLIEQVRNNPAIPIEFGSNKPGMQAGEEDIERAHWSRHRWMAAAMQAAFEAEVLADSGIHKQVVNRLLAPYRWMTTIITSTEAGWNNFFEQRISPLAQPEINALAMEINGAMAASEPREVGYGVWHTPYVSTMSARFRTEQALKVSAARCARVSYLTHDGKRDVSKDLELYDKLVSADPPHWSPLEHVATPREGCDCGCGAGNFDGWNQLRHLPKYQ